MVLGLAGQIVRQGLHRLWPAYFLERDETKRTALLKGAGAYERLAQVYYVINDVLPFNYCTYFGLNLGEAAGPSPVLARIYALMSIAASMVPLDFAARQYSSRARKMADRVESLSAMAWVMELREIYALGVGRWEMANHAAERAIAIAEQLGDVRRYEEALGFWGWALEFQGEFARSAELFAKLQASAERRKVNQVRSWGLIGQAKDTLRNGQFAEAVSALKEAIPFLSGLRARNYETLAYGMLALAYVRQGETQLAKETGAAGMSLIPRWQPRGPYSFYGYTGVAETYLTLWENASADRAPLASAARKACRALKRFARVFPIGEARAHLYQGWYEWLSGNRAKADKSWQRSLAAAERLAMPYEEGLAHYEIGRHRDGAARQHHLARAREIFAKLGASYDLSRAQSAVT